METEKKQRVYKVIMLVTLTAIITFLLTTMVIYKKFESEYITSNVYGDSTTTSSENSLIKTLQEFNTILGQKYRGDINEEKLIEGAMKGYVEGLGDPYTAYLSKDEMSDLIEETNSEYIGIGVYVGNDTKTNTIMVVGVMKGSPALESGMQAGDIIEKIDGIEYTGKQLTEATNILKGEENTKVKVIVLRNNQEIELEITRRKIIIEHVTSEVLQNNIGYIQIDSFEGDKLSEKFEQEYKKLQNNGIKSLILDLRSNGGGIVKQATNIADLFIPKEETILITKDCNDKEEITKANKDAIIKDIPVVILVNEGTASSSEILAGALKDKYSNTKIIGKKTYGKGVIQTLYSLTDGSGLKITTDEYYTPNHNQINKVGIIPDIEIDLTKDDKGNYETQKDKDAQLLKAIEILTK